MSLCSTPLFRGTEVMEEPRKRTDQVPILTPDSLTSPDPEPPPDPSGRYLVGLSLGALGIVYGDIGTSPLYALRESFSAAHGVVPTVTNIMGVLSLIFWALIILISTKYLVFVLRADNRGEGGILALTALVTPASSG